MSKSKLNREWHLAHPMPMKSTLDQRVAWHLEHLQNCACRKDLPPTIQKELERQGIDVAALLLEKSEEIAASVSVR